MSEMCYIGKATKIFILVVAILVTAALILTFALSRHRLHKAHTCVDSNTCAGGTPKPAFQSPVPGASINSFPPSSSSSSADFTTANSSTPQQPNPGDSTTTANSSPPPPPAQFVSPPSPVAPNVPPPPVLPTGNANPAPPPGGLPSDASAAQGPSQLP